MTHWAWYILGASFITTLGCNAIRLGYGVILPEMMKSLGLNRTESGLTYSILIVAYTTFAPIVGFLTDRIGGRKVITCSCAILAIGVLLMSRVNHLVTVVLFLGIVGIGISCGWIPVVALATRWFSARKRGSVLGVINTGSKIGYGISGLIFPLVIARYNWRFAWIILGVFALLMTIINGFVLRSKPEDLNLFPLGEKVNSNGPLSSLPSNYRKMLTRHIFWQIGVSYCLVAFCYYTFVSFIVTYGTLELGITYRVAASFASVLALGGLVGSVPIAALSDFWGRIRTILMSELVVSLSILGLLAARSNLSMIFISIAIFGTFCSAIFPLYAACAGDYFEKEMTGTVLGGWTFIYGAGASAGPLVAGFLSDVTGTLRWGFALAGVASLTAASLLLPQMKAKPGLQVIGS